MHGTEVNTSRYTIDNHDLLRHINCWMGETLQTKNTLAKITSLQIVQSKKFTVRERLELLQMWVRFSKEVM